MYNSFRCQVLHTFGYLQCVNDECNIPVVKFVNNRGLMIRTVELFENNVKEVVYRIAFIPLQLLEDVYFEYQMKNSILCLFSTLKYIHIHCY